MVWFMDEDGIPKPEPTALLVFISVGAYTLSFVNPVAHVAEKGVINELIFGFQAFVLPLMVNGCVALYWFANPAFWLGLLLLHRRRIRGAAITSLVAIALGFLPRCFLDSLSFTTVCLNYGANWAIDSLEVGYYLWLISFVVLEIAALAALAERSRSRAGELPPKDPSRRLNRRTLRS
jgi:hypothetical protein